MLPAQWTIQHFQLALGLQTCFETGVYTPPLQLDFLRLHCHKIGLRAAQHFGIVENQALITINTDSPKSPAMSSTKTSRQIFRSLVTWLQMGTRPRMERLPSRMRSTSH